MDMSTDPRLRAKLFELYDRHYQRALAGGSLANIADPTKMPRHHLRMWDRTYGHLIRSLPHGSEVLDLGCGTGLFLHWLRQFKNIVPVGVDASASMVSLAKEALPDLDITCCHGLEFLRANIGRFRGFSACTFSNTCRMKNFSIPRWRASTRLHRAGFSVSSVRTRPILWRVIFATSTLHTFAPLRTSALFSCWRQLALQNAKHLNHGQRASWGT